MIASLALLSLLAAAPASAHPQAAPIVQAEDPEPVEQGNGAEPEAAAQDDPAANGEPAAENAEEPAATAQSPADRKRCKRNAAAKALLSVLLGERKPGEAFDARGTEC